LRTFPLTSDPTRNGPGLLKSSADNRQNVIVLTAKGELPKLPDPRDQRSAAGDLILPGLAMLMDDPALRKRLAESGRARVRERYDLTTNVQRLSDVFMRRLHRARQDVTCSPECVPYRS
jgi:hypothetical protein